jgi:hypothetical protein
MSFLVGKPNRRFPTSLSIAGAEQSKNEPNQMIAAAVIRFVLFELALDPSLCVQVLGKLDFEEIGVLPFEDAVDEIREAAAEVLTEATAAKLYRIIGPMGRLTSGTSLWHTSKISPRLLLLVTQRMYEDGNAYPFARLHAHYRALCTLGTKSLTFSQTLGELAHVSVDLDPVQMNTIVLDLALQLPCI